MSTSVTLPAPSKQVEAIAYKKRMGERLTRQEEQMLNARLLAETEVGKQGGTIVKSIAPPEPTITQQATAQAQGAVDTLKARDAVMRKAGLPGVLPTPAKSMSEINAETAAKMVKRDADGRAIQPTAKPPEQIRGRFNGQTIDAPQGTPEGTSTMQGANGKWKIWDGTTGDWMKGADKNTLEFDGMDGVRSHFTGADKAKQPELQPSKADIVAKETPSASEVQATLPEFRKGAGLPPATAPGPQKTNPFSPQGNQMFGQNLAPLKDASLIASAPPPVVKQLPSAEEVAKSQAVRTAFDAVPQAPRGNQMFGQALKPLQGTTPVASASAKPAPVINTSGPGLPQDQWGAKNITLPEAPRNTGMTAGYTATVTPGEPTPGWAQPRTDPAAGVIDSVVDSAKKFWGNITQAARGRAGGVPLSAPRTRRNTSILPE